MTISFEQTDALRRIAHWYRDYRLNGGQQVFRLSGPAGSGKTRLAKQVRDSIDGTVAFAALTGKAASVLRAQGCDDADTLHSTIYAPITEQNAAGREIVRFIRNGRGAAAQADMIVVDEASMVDPDLSRDLQAFQKPILALGDPHQLPPIKGVGLLQSGKPDVVLTEIHRQARDSPIIGLATHVRRGMFLKPGCYAGSRVVRPADFDLEALIAADQILVGTAKRRQTVIRRLRALRGQSNDAPVVGDRVVCLRNERKRKLFNGTLFTVTGVIDSKMERIDRLQLASDDELVGSRPRRIRADVHRAYFEGAEETLRSDELACSHFTFADALTVHKAQGSQWNDVFIFDESEVFGENASKWLYSAITRAAQNVTIVTNAGL